MLHLIIRLDGEAYALDASWIVEVLPFVNASKVARASAGISGVINYRGQIVPLVDLAAITVGRASEPRLSTRIVLMQSPQGGRLFGLIAENATDLQRIEPANFGRDGVSAHGPSHLGSIAIGPQGPIQRLELDRLSPDDGDLRSQCVA